MKRREFITLLGGAAAAWPLAARAQQHPALPTIGFFGTTAPATWTAWTPAFVQRLRELGWIEGRTVAIEWRWAEGRSERFAEIAAELVRLKVDVIVTSGGGVPAAKQATSVIPIVFPLAADPLGGGLVASLSRPGGNITGLSQQAADVAGKRLEILREILPRLRRLAILTDVGIAQSVISRGGDLTVEYRSAEGDPKRLPALAAELVRASPDLLIAGFGTLAAKAAQAASTTIPIVFTGVGDPVGAGIVASLNRPGANVTGVTSQASDVVGKRLQISG
jgi:ABC-type uncharacterized transport system substrate-binding protein